MAGSRIVKRNRRANGQHAGAEGAGGCGARPPVGRFPDEPSSPHLSNTGASVGAILQCRNSGPAQVSRHSRGPENVADGGTAQQRLTQLAPVPLIQLHLVLLRSGFDAFPGCIAFRVGHSLHLLETGDCVAHVSRIMVGSLRSLGKANFSSERRSRLSSEILGMPHDKQTNGEFTRAIAGTRRQRRSIRAKPRPH